MLSAPINVSASGATVVVTAQAGRRIRVLGFILSGAAAVNVKWQDGTPTDLSGLMTIPAAGTSIVAPIAPPVVGSQQYWIITAAAQALLLNLSAAVAVGGILIYDVVS